MRNKSFLWTWLSVVVIAVFLSGCASFPPPSESNFKDPVVTLDYVDVAHYFGWWFYNSKVKPTSGTAGNNSAPLVYAFIFDIYNPNRYPIKLENLKFACVLDGFELNSGYSTEAMWIPAGKTNQLRVEVLYDFNGTFLSLGVVAGMKLKEKGVSIMDEIEKIWKGAPDFSFPVGVTQGAAVFKADGVTKVVGFEGTYPK
jgi:hypothetical protein